jgi:hypothetical protein
MGRQMFARGGQVYPMQDGGMAPPMAPPPQQGPAPQMPGMLAMGGQEGVDINAAAQGAMQQGIDPTILEGLLGNYASQMEDLDNAQDYETVMNGIRGDQIPVEGRYAELAEVVGQEDAQATPESVLTLLQPVMMMAAVDQGIGGLAQDEMSAPIEGAMAEGIMSTVNMGAPEGPAPVNFNQGGAVQYMAAGGPPLPAPGVAIPQIGGRQGDIFREQQSLYQSLLNPASEAADLDEQTELTKAQMLFDIAQGALAFASPGDRPMSPAERLAQSFTPVIGNIGARAGELGKFKQAQKAQTKQMDMAALQASGALYGAERSAALTEENKDIGDVYQITVTGEDGTVTKNTGPLTRKTYADLQNQHGASNVSIMAIAKPTGTVQKAENFMLNGAIISATPGTPGYDYLISQGAVTAGDVPTSAITTRKQYTLPTDLTIGDKTYAAGTSPFFSELEASLIFSSLGADALVEYVPPLDDKDYMTAYKMTKAQFEALPTSDKQYMQGLPVITDKDYFAKTTMSKNDFLSLPAISRQRILGIETEYEFKQINNGKTIDVVRYDKNDPDVAPVSIYSSEILQDPDLFKITMPNAEGVSVATIVDLSTDSGKAALAKVNELNKANPGAAVMQKIGTESFVSKAFLVPDSTAGGGAEVRMSFDGGQTYIGSDGLPRQLPPNAFELSNTISNDVYRKEKVRSSARDWLRENDQGVVSGLTTPQGGGSSVPSSEKDKALVTDTLQQVRNGTGFWSGFNSAVNAVLGGVLAPQTFSELYRDTEEGRQYVQLIRVMGRSALAASPRFAVADLQATEELFPSEEALFRNPVSEANKLALLVEALKAEEVRLQELRASPVPQDTAVLATASQKLQEIARLKELLGPVLIQGGGQATTESVKGATRVMQSKGRVPWSAYDVK